MLATSGFTIALLVIVPVLLLVLLGGLMRSEGRAAESHTPVGDRPPEPPGFRKPKDY